MKPTNPAPGSHGSPRRHDDGVVHHPHLDASGHDDLHNEDVAHEHSDVNMRAIISSAVVIALVMIGSWILMYFMFGWLESRAAADQPTISTLAPAPTDMPKHTDSPFFSQGVGGPQLLTNEPMALQKNRADWAEKLGTYGWVNQGAGVAHVPIDEAKKLLLQKGLAVREGSAATAFTIRPWARGEASGGRTTTVDLPDRTDSGAPAPAQEHGAQPAGHDAPATPAPSGNDAPAKPAGQGGH